MKNPASPRKNALPTDATGPFEMVLDEEDILAHRGETETETDDGPQPWGGTVNAPKIDYRVTTQVREFVSAIWRSPGRKTLNWLTFGIIAVVCATAAGQIELNRWYRPFYDAIEQRDLPSFWRELLVFVGIATVLLGLNVLQTWLTQTIKVKSREWLTRDLFENWLVPKRAFLLTNSGAMGVNPDQRIHEDARHLTELSADLGVGVFQASLLLGSFIGVLWFLSQEVVFSWNSSMFAIPGYMVWCALLYAMVGSYLGYRVGRPLVNLDIERYAREANMRFELVRAAEHIDGIALYAGERNEQRRIDVELRRVLIIMRRVVSRLTMLTWVTAGYGWFAIVFPILVAAPGYFSGSLSFGKLMMVVGAFNQVQMSLRWFVDNLGAIADWRATLRRVIGFRQTLIALDQVEGQLSHIAFVEHPQGHLAFESLEMLSAAGVRTRLEEERVDVLPGERVLIIGSEGASKSTLFRALAGLWPWGAGRVLLPARQDIWFLPQRPYVQPGPLRDALLYPQPPEGVTRQDLAWALERTGLKHLVAHIEDSARWDKELGLDEQKRLALARVLLHRPAWVFIDESIDMLDRDLRELLFSVFKTDLMTSGIVSFSRHDTNGGFYHRKLHLVPCESCVVSETDETRGVPPEPEPTPSQAPTAAA